MSGSIDERVVSLKFDAEQFQRGIKTTLDSLASLNKGLQLQGATKGLTDVQQAANGMHLANIAKGVDAVASRFSAMGIVAVTALTNIANKAVNAGLSIAKSLTIDPIKAGLESYNQQISATQVILANTKSAGTSLKDVTASLAQLQQYANLTVFSFSEMTENIGRFTAAGVPLKQATSAIKGLANVAALSGASTQQMSSAMYQMSQALSTGTLRLQDWNSLSNANMAGTNIQKAIEATARSMGDVTGDKMTKAIKKFGSFRQSLQSGWLTGDIFSKTMGIMAGTIDQATGKMKAFSVAQLEQKGYSKKDAEQLHELSQSALDSAIKIRTLPQLMQALKEEVATAWGQVFKTIFGDINQATDLFTNIHNVAENALTKPIYNLNQLLEGWAKLGGRAKAIDAVTNAFRALGSFLKPIKDAFREIFPPTTALELVKITTAIDNFMKRLILGSDTANNLKRTFAGFFAVLDIGWQIIKGVAGVFLDLFNAATSGSGGFLKFTARIGDWLVSVDKALKNGKGLQKFFDGLSAVLQKPIQWISEFVGWINQLFDAIDGSKIQGAGAGLDRLQARFAPLGKLGEGIAKVWSKVGDIMSRMWTAFQPIASKLGDFFHNLGESISSAIQNINWNTVLDAVNTGLFAGLILLIKNFMGNLGKKDLSGGIISSIKESFGQLTDTLKTLQAGVKANILLKIAEAVGLLTLSIVALSLINSDKLTKSLTAVTAMMIQLMGGLAILNTASSSKSIAKLPALASGLILLAIAIDLLTIAVAGLSRLKWEELAKGLIGTTVLIGALVLAARGLRTESKGMISSGAGLILLAVGVRILVGAVQDFSSMSWSDIAKGLTGVAALLLALALYSKFNDADAGGITSGAGIILLAVGLKILVGVVQDFSKLSWAQIAKGLITIAAALTIIGIAVNSMDEALPGAASLLIVAAALKIITPVLTTLGNLTWSQIAKGLVSVAGALTIMAVAANAMDEAEPGAVAILILAAALRILTPVLTTLGSMTWGEIAKGLVAVAGALLIMAVAANAMDEAEPGAAAILVLAVALRVLTPVLTTLGNMSVGQIAKALITLALALAILGGAAALLTPVLPSLLLLGAAILLIGAGTALAGAGLFLISAGLVALAASGAAAAGALKGIVLTLVDLGPSIAIAMGKSIIAFAKVIGDAAPAIIEALEKILIALLDAVIKIAPKLGQAFKVLILTGLSVIRSTAPAFVATGLAILIAFLTGIRDNIGRITTLAVQIILNFLAALRKQAPLLANAGVQTLVTFMNAFADAIRSHNKEINEAGKNIASAIISGIVSGLEGGVSGVATAAENVAKGAYHAAMGILKAASPSKLFIQVGRYVVQGFIIGLKSDPNGIKNAFSTMKSKLQDVIKTTADAADKAEAKLKKLNAAKKKDTAAIRETTAALKEANKEHREAVNAYAVLTKAATSQQATLIKLATTHATLTQKIKDQTDALNDAIKTRDDFNASTTQSFETLPDISGDTQLDDYVTTLQKQISDTQSFATMIQKLRDLGLNDTAYKDLLAKGISALPFMQQLLDGGKSAVMAIDSLDDQLDTAAAGLGQSASTVLYQAGVDAAQGLLNGLKSKDAAIVAQMTALANKILVAMKKKLGIKSPSKEFAKIGQYANEGLAQGLDAYSDVVTKSAENVGSDAIFALQKSISGMSDLVNSQVDINPTITPVLDLTSVQKDAASISSMLTPSAVQVGSGYQMAKIAAAGYSTNQSVAANQAADAAAGLGPAVQFIQNNNSPKALSPAEIYRQTKNQLSVAKGALKT